MTTVDINYHKSVCDGIPAERLVSIHLKIGRVTALTDPRAQGTIAAPNKGLGT
jgi:hypothetical protein